ncbi:unnamed protein product [Enterobius vermicularis]|uniref:Activin_recp domain-containing protein n=1 Tax=Enterobius vermicularis TaxID=51028 RepID=A0A0N4V7T6_ENTVE|nr:unnamed protein product [Enterobius vermicularis]
MQVYCYIYVLLLTKCFLKLSFAEAEHQCYSCFSYCKTLPNGSINTENCDCTGQFCTSEHCFAKIEIFAEEQTAIIQKGCITDVVGSTEGCQYAGHSESVHCYCTGNRCNSREQLNNFKLKPLPSVDCCECSEPQEDRCPDKNCIRRCRGNYCLIDFDGIEQGCGLGYPRLQSFLRTRNYADWQGKTTCARYQASHITTVHGCVCTEPTGSCNEVNRTRQFQLEKVIQRRENEQNYCYSLHYKSKAPFGEEVFKNSDTCEGQFCFISITTSELFVESTSFEEEEVNQKSFIGLSRPSYEILAGCLKVDDDSKVNIGCTTEFTANSSEPLTKHCICDSHLCNFYHLLTDKEDSRRRNES